MRVLHCVLFIVLTEAEELRRRRQGPRRGNVNERTPDRLMSEHNMRHFNEPGNFNRAGNIAQYKKEPNPENAGFVKTVKVDKVDKVDSRPLLFDVPVPFGHIYKDGFADSLYGIKQPMNFLEYNMRTPKDLKEKLYLLEHGDPEKMQFFADPPNLRRTFVEETPRDRFMRERGLLVSKARGVNELKWYDLGDLHERNMANPPVPRNQPKEVASKPMAPRTPPQADMLGDLRYDQLFNPPKKVNFTTCDEMGARAYFHPKDIVNLVWIPFYIWSLDPAQSAVPHTFTYATKKFVSTYREIYKGLKDIDWERPKLMMKGKGEFLIISMDKRGLFHALQVLNLPENFFELNVTLPYAKIRIKTVDPYLILMFCDLDYIVAMAVQANIPSTNSEKISEAESLDIRGPGAPVTLDRTQEVIARMNLEKGERLDLELKRYMPDMPNTFPQLPNEEEPERPQGGMGTFG